MTIPSFDDAYRQHAKHVWGIVYRMTGSAADADDLVQDTFVRAMSRPPSGELRPWLGRIAVNAGIDLLRQRKRRAYVGPWLPEPIETDEDTPLEPAELGADRRYDLLESVSFAFLVALEALTPRARAVLLLCDVFDYSGREVAEALCMTEGHVKVTHHRARRMMGDYDRERVKLTRDVRGKTQEALGTLLQALASGDVARVEALLAADVRTLNDSAGEYHAARVPVVGRERVARFWTNVSKSAASGSVELRTINGLPAILVDIVDAGPRIAHRTLFMVRLGAHGLIAEIHGIVATQKLARLLRSRA